MSVTQMAVDSVDIDGGGDCGDVLKVEVYCCAEVA